MNILDITNAIGKENITLPSPHPVSFILPSLLKNIEGLVYIITTTTNIYNQYRHI